MAVAQTIGPEAIRTLEDSELIGRWLAADGHDSTAVARVWVLEDGLVELDLYRVDAAGHRFRDPLTGEAALERVKYRPSSPPPAALAWTRSR